MKIEVQFFSRLRDLAGATKLERSLPDGATIAELLETLYVDFPKLREWDPHLLTAVGFDWSPREQVLQDGDSVSVMPPVQWG